MSNDEISIYDMGRAGIGILHKANENLSAENAELKELLQWAMEDCEETLCELHGIAHSLGNSLECKRCQQYHRIGDILKENNL